MKRVDSHRKYTVLHAAVAAIASEARRENFGIRRRSTLLRAHRIFLRTLYCQASKRASEIGGARAGRSRTRAFEREKVARELATKASSRLREMHSSRR